MATTRDSLEAALVAEPENLALHSAYADLLIEEGDPRGEYIRLELMLEDEGLAEGVRADLIAQMKVIFETHNVNWIGNGLHAAINQINSVEIDGMHFSYKPVEIKWLRGWISEVRLFRPVSMHHFTILERAPVKKLNQKLTIENVELSHIFFRTRLSNCLDSIPFQELSFVDWNLFSDEWLGHLVDFDIFREREINKLSLIRCNLTDDGAEILANNFDCYYFDLDLSDNYITSAGVDILAQSGFENIGPQLWNPAWDGEANGD